MLNLKNVKIVIIQHVKIEIKLMIVRNILMKSNNYISWDEYFMGVAMLSALRSKDPSTKVGACIVNQKKRIVGIGYNGFPCGCDDDEFPWERSGDLLDTKYPYVVHAEPNAILNSTSDLTNSTLYVTLFPCNECAKLIIQSGIKEIVFVSDKYHDTEASTASRRMFDAAKVKYRQMDAPKINLE
jgi:dCMP deaminase